MCVYWKGNHLLIKNRNSTTLYYIRRKRTKSPCETEKSVPCSRMHEMRSEQAVDVEKQMLVLRYQGWCFPLGKTAFSVSHLLKERALCLGSVLLCPITSLHHFSGPLNSSTVPDSFCSVGLMLLWRSDIGRLWLGWAIRSRWCLHNPWVSHCALLLRTRVIIINGRGIGWAQMQVFQGGLQSSIL